MSDDCPVIDDSDWPRIEYALRLNEDNSNNLYWTGEKWDVEPINAKRYTLYAAASVYFNLIEVTNNTIDVTLVKLLIKETPIDITPASQDGIL